VQHSAITLGLYARDAFDGAAQPFGQKMRRLAVMVAMLYAAFVPMSLLCSLHWTLFILTWILGICSFVLSGLVWMVERHNANPHWKEQVICGVCRDATQFVRLAFTILFPMFLAFFEGTSFLVGLSMETLSQRADPCSVRQLSQLDATGYMQFACADGFIAVDLQLGVPAWGTAVSQREQRQALSGLFMHRMGRHVIHRQPHKEDSGDEGSGIDDGGGGGGHEGGSDSKPSSPDVVEAEATEWKTHNVGESKGNRFGYVAPLYESFAHFEAGEGPVAWAVKAGQPVKRSHCPDDVGIHRTCGMFALRLQNRWRSLSRTPDWFGQRWGFNITHFSYEQMLDAREELIRRFPDLNLTSLIEPTFVVAEDVQEYFGRSYSILWVVMSLLILGFMDRMAGLFSSRSVMDYEKVNGLEPEDTEEYFQPGRPFNDVYVTDGPLDQQVSDILAEGTPREPARSMLEEARQFWSDALGTRSASSSAVLAGLDREDQGLSPRWTSCCRSAQGQKCRTMARYLTVEEQVGPY